MKEAGAQAARLLFDRIHRGSRWEKSYRQLDFWIPLGAQCTLMAPMEPIMTERASIGARSGIAELAFCFGFPYADFPDCGPGLVAYADSQE